MTRRGAGDRLVKVGGEEEPANCQAAEEVRGAGLAAGGPVWITGARLKGVVAAYGSSCSMSPSSSNKCVCLSAISAMRSSVSRSSKSACFSECGTEGSTGKRLMTAQINVVMKRRQYAIQNRRIQVGNGHV